MAKVKEIEVGIGLSIDKNGLWVKTDSRVKVAVDEGDSVHECFERAFEIADEEVSKQLDKYGIDTGET